MLFEESSMRKPTIGGASDGMPEALWEEVLQEEPESSPRPPQ